MANIKTAKYDRPPNYLVVDFYNEGPTNGSVFEVAALANGVTYNRKCCGPSVRQNGAGGVIGSQVSTAWFGIVVAFLGALVL